MGISKVRPSDLPPAIRGLLRLDAVAKHKEDHCNDARSDHPITGCVPHLRRIQQFRFQKHDAANNAPQLVPDGLGLVTQELPSAPAGGGTC